MCNNQNKFTKWFLNFFAFAALCRTFGPVCYNFFLYKKIMTFDFCSFYILFQIGQLFCSYIVIFTKKKWLKISGRINLNNRFMGTNQLLFYGQLIFVLHTAHEIFVYVIMFFNLEVYGFDFNTHSKKKQKQFRKNIYF